MRLSELRVLHLAGASPAEPLVARHLLPDLFQSLLLNIPKAQWHISAGQCLSIAIHMNHPDSPAHHLPEPEPTDQTSQGQG